MWVNLGPRSHWQTAVKNKEKSEIKSFKQIIQNPAMEGGKDEGSSFRMVSYCSFLGFRG